MMLWTASLLLLTVLQASNAALTTAFDERGLTLLSYNGLALVDLDNKVGQSFYVGTYILDGVSGWGQVGATQSWNATTQTLLWSWQSWNGNLSCVFNSSVTDTLGVSCTVINNSGKTLNAIDIYMFGLQFPRVPYEFGGPFEPQFHNNLDAPTAIPGSYDTGMVVLVDNDPSPKYLGYESTGPAAYYLLRFGTYADQSMAFLGPADPVIRPVQSGATDTYGFQMRFAPNGTDYVPMVADYFAAYREAWPQELKWPDRRPIGQCFMTNPTNSPISNSSGNPRGYSFATSLDVNTPDGLAAFQAAALAYANSSLQILQKVGSQGVLIWDLEGQQYPQPDTSYVGDPSLLPIFSPEMDSIADKFFATFTDAGLKCGMTIRPELILFNGTSGPTQYYIPGQESALMIRKMGYAYKRWGCTLFYVDSNGGPDSATEPAYFEAVMQALPDILIFPENIATKYYAYTAPLATYLAPYKPLHTPPLAYALWNESFSLTYIGDAPNHDLTKNPNNPNQWDEFVQAVKNGDILSFRAWFDDEPLNSQVTQIYQQAGVDLFGPQSKLKKPIITDANKILIA